MHDTAHAEKIYLNLIHIGYILEIAEGLYLPLDTHGSNYTGPTHEKDAKDIVLQFHQDPIKKKFHLDILKK
jgi:hypothetical protein